MIFEIPEQLYGIHNNLSIGNSKEGHLLIFAPNGTGKSSIARWLKHASKHDAREKVVNLEGDVMADNMIFNGMTYQNIYDEELKIKIIDGNEIEKLLENSSPVLDYFKKNSTYYADIENLNDRFNKLYEECETESPEVFLFLQSDAAMRNDLKKELVPEILKTINYSDYELSPKERLSKNEEIAENQNNLKSLMYIQNEKYLSKKLKTLKMTEKREFSGVEQLDFEILQYIKERNREHYFGYRKKADKEYEPINSAFERIKKQLEKEKFPVEKLASFLTLQKIIKKNPEFQQKPTMKKIIDMHKKNTDTLVRDVLKSLIFKKKEEFVKIQDKVIKNKDNFVKETNKAIIKINSRISEEEKINWKWEIRPIEKYCDSIEINTMQDNKKRKTEDLKTYASSGQKRILSLIVSLLDVDDCDYVIFDDPITSLDSDNVSVFASQIGRILKLETSNVKILIMTHDYRLLTTMGFHHASLKNFVTYILDASYEEGTKTISKSIAFEVDARKVAKLTPVFKESVQKKHTMGLIIFLSSILREIISTYLLKEKKWTECNQLKKIIHYIDSHFRHWKNDNRTLKNFQEKIKDVLKNEDSEIRNLLFGEGGIFYVLLDEKNSENHNMGIENYVLDFNLKKDDLGKSFGLLNYLVIKYILSLQLRFRVEKAILSQQKNKVALEEWGKDDTNVLLSLPLFVEKITKTKLSDAEMKMWQQIQSMNFINHINNLRWTAIMEIPFFKIELYRQNIENIIFFLEKNSLNSE